MDGVGEVHTQFLTLRDADLPFRLESGEHLPAVTLAYETYGALSEAKDNAILVFHALSGGQHAAGENRSVPGCEAIWTEECRRGWWDGFIGPGRAFDTDRFFVLCVNYLGGCYGSTGPSSIDPRTGLRYAGAFPRITLSDIVNSQIRLLDHLGIRQLHAATGGSLGGMMCLNLACRFPDRVRLLIPMATGLNVTSLQRIINFEQIYAIENDPHFQGGGYYDGPSPDTGVALARMISHKTFVSLQMLEERARDEIVGHSDVFQFYQITNSIESYMLHQGRKFTRRFDANTYLRILDAWQTFDLLRDTRATAYPEAFRVCRGHRYLVFTIDSDVCYYPEEQADLARALKAARVPHHRFTVHSEKGHDAFLLEPDLFTPHLVHALERAWP